MVINYSLVSIYLLLLTRMEHNHILLLQLVIATFEGNEDYYDLLNECDKHILLHANGPEEPVTIAQAASDFIASLDNPPATSPNLPDKLALLAAMEPANFCKGCGTPNPTKDEGNNCDVCGYPGFN